MNNILNTLNKSQIIWRIINWQGTDRGEIKKPVRYEEKGDVSTGEGTIFIAYTFNIVEEVDDSKPCTYEEAIDCKEFLKWEEFMKSGNGIFG